MAVVQRLPAGEGRGQEAFCFAVVGRAKAHERLFLLLDLREYPVLPLPECFVDQRKF